LCRYKLGSIINGSLLDEQYAYTYLPVSVSCHKNIQNAQFANLAGEFTLAAIYRICYAQWIYAAPTSAVNDGSSMFKRCDGARKGCPTNCHLQYLAASSNSSRSSSRGSCCTCRKDVSGSKKNRTTF